MHSPDMPPPATATRSGRGRGLHLGAQRVAERGHRVVRRGQGAGGHVEVVPQPGVAALFDGDAGAARALGQPRRIGCERVVARRMDDERRQAGQIRVQRRDGRVRRGRAIEVGPREAPQRRRAQLHVAGRRAVPGGVGAEVQPRADQADRRGQRLARVAQGQRGRQGEPAARGVAGQRDALRRHAVFDERRVDREHVLQRGGMTILGRAAVVGDDRDGAGAHGDASGQGAVRARGAEDVAAAVQVEHHGVARHARGRQPIGRHAADRRARHDRVRRDRGQARDQLDARALRRHGHPRGEQRPGRAHAGADGGPREPDRGAHARSAVVMRSCSRVSLMSARMRGSRTATASMPGPSSPRRA